MRFRLTSLLRGYCGDRKRSARARCLPRLQQSLVRTRL